MRKKGKALREAQAALGEGAGSASGEVATPSAPPLPEFTPVPRKYRHDGWTPERQKAFIEALADTGCVTRAGAILVLL